MADVDRKLVVALGRALVSRGLVLQASAMRLYLLALDRGLLDRKRELNVAVSPAFIIDWCGTLQIPPHETRFLFRRPDERGCPVCGDDVPTYVELSVLDRMRTRCSKCTLRWVTIIGG